MHEIFLCEILKNSKYVIYLTDDDNQLTVFFWIYYHNNEKDEERYDI
jgi:hypothetical protein